MNEKKSGGRIAFLFAILGIISIIFLKSIIGLIFAIISLILSIKDLKCKNGIVYVSLVVSILEIIFYIISLIISFSFVNNTLSNAKMQTYIRYEDMLKMNAKMYVREKQINNGDDDFVINTDTLLTNTDLKKYENCVGYVVVNQNDYKYDAYIKCDKYQTEGFDNSKLEY